MLIYVVVHLRSEPKSVFNLISLLKLAKTANTLEVAYLKAFLPDNTKMARLKKSITRETEDSEICRILRKSQTQSDDIFLDIHSPLCKPPNENQIENLRRPQGRISYLNGFDMLKPRPLSKIEICEKREGNSSSKVK